MPTIGGPISSVQPIGAFDQREAPAFFGARPPYRPLAERPDILVFQTAPLIQAVEVTGPIVVHLWISSDGLDTDVTAKLIDVYPPNADYPDGYAMNLTGGITPYSRDISPHWPCSDMLFAPPQGCDTQCFSQC